MAEERRDVEANVQPAWLRLRLDLVMLVAAALIGGITYLTGGFKPTAIEGQSVSLSFYILLAPLCFWIGATLLLVRLLLFGISRGGHAGGKVDFRKIESWLGIAVREDVALSVSVGHTSARPHLNWHERFIIRHEAAAGMKALGYPI